MSTQSDRQAQVQYNTGARNDYKPTTRLKLADIVRMPNIAVKLKPAELDGIGSWVVSNYNLDRQTRMEWEQRNEEAIKLALQVVEVKSFPWTNCSNIKFPLLTIASLQFLARISILTKGKNLVKLETLGRDVDGKKGQAAARISTHMSYQLTDEDINWADDDEKAKLSASIMGCAIKKTHYDSVSGITTSEYVPAMNFVVDYYCKHLEKANRVTHLLKMDENTLHERFRRGLFLEMAVESPPAAQDYSNLLQIAADNAEGITRPVDGYDNFDILEQHCWMDLDDDGYCEPYIVYVRRDTQQTLRVVARFTDTGDVHRVNDQAIRNLEHELKQLQWELQKAQIQGQGPQDQSGDSRAGNTPAQPQQQQQQPQQQPAQPAPQVDVALNMKQQSAIEKQIDRLTKADDNHVIRIDPIRVFTKYTFIPSPDGGFYGLGFGALLGPLNESVDTLVNQLVDAGTMSNSGGGFLARGVKIKGGKTSFDPFEWKPVDSTGDDLRKNIFPLPVREPSAVLFQLLGMLVGYAEKISGATDIMTGVSPGQNTPAETSRNTVEQGMMLFSGIYARMYRSFREELRQRYELNRLYLSSSPQYWELVDGPNAILSPDDYDSSRHRIFPTADASTASASQRKEKAGILVQMASSQPGFNRYLVNKKFLEAYEFEDIEQILPDPAGPNAIQPPPNPEIELKKAKLQQEQQEHKDHMQLAAAELQTAIQLNGAKISELQAKATKEVSEAQGVNTGHQIALIEAQIGAAKTRQDGLLSALKTIQAQHGLLIQQDKHQHQKVMDHMQASQSFEQHQREMQQPQEEASTPTPQPQE